MSGKKRVLLISYYFPPSGMGGVQRAVKFAKYLPYFNWDVTVLTVKDILYYQTDNSLLEDAGNAEIVRTGSLDPLRLGFLLSRAKTNRPSHTGIKRRQRLFRFLEQRLFIPDSKILWLPFAFIRSFFIIKRNRFQAIISTAPPFSSHILGLLLSTVCRLPWIADFRDGWSDKDILPPKGVVHFVLNRFLERVVIKNADRITCISEKIVTYEKALHPQEIEKCFLLYNGFDEQDFYQGRRSNNNFTITFFGTATEWTNPAVFLPSLASVLEHYPEVREKVAFRIVGTMFHHQYINSLEKIIDGNRIDQYGYVPHKEAVQLLQQSDLLLFPVTKYDTTGHITGKLFEYLAAGLPILAHTPHGEAREILKKYAREVFFDDGNDADKASKFILEKFTQWQSGKGSIENQLPGKSDRRFAHLELFNRKNQAGMMAGYLNGLQNASGT